MDNCNVTLQIHDDFKELSKSSLELLSKEKFPFLNYQWFSAVNKYISYSIGTEKWLALCKNGKTVALLPMVERHRGKLRILQSLSNYYSPYFNCISSEVPEELILTSLIQHAKTFLASYDVIEFLPVTTATRKEFLNAFQGDDWSFHSYQHSINWRQTGISDFDTYWKSRPSQLKTTIRRKLSKLKELNYKVKIHSTNLPDSALADFHKIYFKSWKNNEPFPSFIDAIATNSSLQGTLRLGNLYVDSKPVASQLWLVVSNTAYIVKLAYDPKYADFSVGSILSYRMFEHAIEIDKVNTIDYLTGNDAYKIQWTDTSRELYGIEFYNNKSFLGLLESMKNYVRGNLRQIYLKCKN